jgi:hypothetical protein
MMIAARMRDDDIEVKKLVASAERRQFTIRANYESDICEAWHRAHLILISINADSHIKQLKCALTCWKLVSDDDNEFDDDLAEKVFNLELFHRQARKVTMAAFMDWIEEHNLPFEKELLEACGIELSLLDDEDRDELRKYASYSDIYSLFTNVWKHR